MASRPGRALLPDLRRLGDAADDRALQLGEERGIGDRFVGAALVRPHAVAFELAELSARTLGAAGVVEAIISLLTIRHGVIPANANTAEIDPKFRCRHLTTSAPARIDHVMTNSFGFGGSNCSLVFGRPS